MSLVLRGSTDRAAAALVPVLGCAGGASCAFPRAPRDPREGCVATILEWAPRPAPGSADEVLLRTTLRSCVARLGFRPVCAGSAGGGGCRLSFTGGTDSILEKHLEQGQREGNTSRLSWVLPRPVSHELLPRSLRSFYLRIYFRLLSKGEASFLKCVTCVYYI